MATKTTQSYPQSMLEHYEEKIIAQLQAAENSAVTGVRTARRNIEQKLARLATANAAQVTRAKVDIDAAAVALKAALDEFDRKIAAISGDITGKEN